MAIQLALNLTPKAARPQPQRPELIAAGGVIGWASAIFGIGGGSLTVPFFWYGVVLLYKKPWQLPLPAVFPLLWRVPSYLCSPAGKIATYQNGA